MKLRKLIKEWGAGGVVSIKAIGNPFKKQNSRMYEGPSYEYANYMKKIEKAENQQAKEVNNLVKLLQKKGLKKEATLLGAKYMKGMRDFNDTLKKLYHKLV